MRKRRQPRAENKGERDSDKNKECDLKGQRHNRSDEWLSCRYENALSREQRHASAGRQRKRNNYCNPMFIHAFSTEMIQIQGKKHMKIKAIQVEKEAFIRGYFPRWPVIPGKHFSLIKKRKKTGRSKHFRAARQTNASFMRQKTNLDVFYFQLLLAGL